jgi:hypothetical protein
MAEAVTPSDKKSRTKLTAVTWCGWAVAAAIGIAWLGTANMGKSSPGASDYSVASVGNTPDPIGDAMAANSLSAEEQAALSKLPWRPLPNKWNFYPTGSPFEAVKWENGMPHVQVGGNWYALLAINGVTAVDIMKFAHTQGGSEEDSEKHFEEDLVALLSMMHYVPSSINVNLRVIDAGDVTRTLENIPMTQLNRRTLHAARAAADKASETGN